MLRVMNPKIIGGVAGAGVVAALLLLLKFGPEGGPATDRGLLLHLPLSTDLADHSRFQHPIKVVGKVQLEDGAARFPGDGHLEAPHLSLEKRPFAVSMWLMAPVMMNNQWLLDQWHSDADNHHLTVFLSGARPSFGFEGNNVWSKRKGLLANDWNHVMFVFTGDQQQIWVNGEMVGNAAARPYEGTEGATIIGRPQTPTNTRVNFDGWMRDLRVYEGYFERKRILALREAGPKAR